MEIGFCLRKEFLSLLLNCRLCEPWRLTQNDTEDLIFKANKNPNGISDVIPGNCQVLRMFRRKKEAQLLYFNLVLYFRVSMAENFVTYYRCQERTVLNKNLRYLYGKVPFTSNLEQNSILQNLSTPLSQETRLSQNSPTANPIQDFSAPVGQVCCVVVWILVHNYEWLAWTFEHCGNSIRDATVFTTGKENKNKMTPQSNWKCFKRKRPRTRYCDLWQTTGSVFRNNPTNESKPLNQNFYPVNTALSSFTDVILHFAQATPPSDIHTHQPSFVLFFQIIIFLDINVPLNDTNTYLRLMSSIVSFRTELYNVNQWKPFIWKPGKKR